MSERVEVRPPQLATLHFGQYEIAVRADDQLSGLVAHDPPGTSADLGRPGRAPGPGTTHERQRSDAAAGPSALRIRTTGATSAPASAPCARAASAPSSAAAAASRCFIGLELHPLPIDGGLEPEADRRRVQVAELEILPPQPEQLTLARADHRRKPEQRAPRLRRRCDRLSQLAAREDAPLRRRADPRPLALLELGERVVAAPRAMPDARSPILSHF
jgi:hypothetical protein